MAGFSIDEKRAEIEKVGTWRHAIDVGDGIVTPGASCEKDAELLQIPADLAGKRVLDVGCSDGGFSFLCEDAGASEIMSIDDLSSHLNPGKNGFETAARLRNSNARFENMDVIDLDPESHGQFDIVLLINVFYHLRYPMLALDRLAAVTKAGGTMLMKSWFNSDFRIGFRERAIQFDFTNRPKLWFHPNAELQGDPTNWFAPNRRALEAMLGAAGFETQHLATRRNRIYYRATM